MGALTKLDIRSNLVTYEQEGELRRICAAGGTELATEEQAAGSAT